MEELESNDDDYEQKQIYLAAALYAHFQFLTLDKAQYCCALLYFFPVAFPDNCGVEKQLSWPFLS